MALVVRETIRDSIIFRADLPTAEPRRVSDDQLNVLINRSLLRLQGLLVSLHSEDYFKVILPFQVDAGNTTIELTGAPKILHVFWVSGKGTSKPQTTRLEVTKDTDLERWGGLLNVWTTAEPPTWKFDSDILGGGYRMVFIPGPAKAETLFIEAQGEFIYTADGDALEFFYGWEEWIILDALVAIRQRDKQEFQDIAAERQRTEQQIREQAVERKKDERVTVLDRERGGISQLRDPLDV